MPKITVGIRFKPEESSNISKNLIVRDDTSIDFHVTGTKHEFQYDRLFPASCDQDTVFKRSTAHIVDDVLEGFNGCVLTYGQTGAGMYIYIYICIKMHIYYLSYYIIILIHIYSAR